ncbi:hypothetical protein HUS91_18100 [Pseudomonas chlororaphis]|uniref:SbcC/MukB-like Walker B domain-containing protein n=1 Tax=Pseudomonas chlororaphis TaxID=587753 RepID=UPI001B33EABC|nr:SbcC/MukB-like Walker B domain-containing protein [Pseudomonas chlororaphis]MBP5087405.1 hypothetical protein [Pseudomonas chlororaphis]
MKRLERVNLIQFFLYDAKDVDIGLNTAFLGPNGTGKTALLDAIQTVMLAADGNRINFNAASEGKKHSRSLQEYCLGSYVPGGSHFKRTAANTYLGLVFRDQVTGVPFTAGISLQAHAEDSSAVINGYFILPGVALTAEQYLQTEGQRVAVIPWRSFQPTVADLCRMEGTIPHFIPGRNEFLRRLLIDQLAGPGDKPNSEAFRAAFSRSLKLNEKIVDLNETLRQHLIEPMPTQISEFRARLNEVREMRDLIRRLRERIDRATVIVDHYKVVQTERTTEANLEALKHVYAVERVGEALDALVAEHEATVVLQQQTKDQLALAQLRMKLADKAKENAITALTSNPEFQQQAGYVDKLELLEVQVHDKQDELKQLLKGMQNAVTAVSALTDVEIDREALQETHAQLRELEQSLNKNSVPPSSTFNRPLAVLKSLCNTVRRATSEKEREATKALDMLKDAETARSRANRGLSALDERTTALLRILANAGIEATPICDLVTVTDPAWLPVIESWLGRHVEALLIPAEQELEAIKVYRSKAAEGIFRVKLALPSRIREWHANDTANYAAQLIEGNNALAVRYLQGELGRTTLAESNEQIRAGTKAISKDGMVSSGGGIERRQLPSTLAVKLGRRDASSTAQQALRALQEAEAHHAAATSAAAKLGHVFESISPYADSAVLQSTLERLFTQKIQSASSVTDLRERLAQTQTPELEYLQAKKLEAVTELSNASETVNKLNREEGAQESQLKSLLSKIDELKKQLELNTALEKESQQNPFFNANEVERHRNRLDERHADNWPVKRNQLDAAIQSAQGKATSNATDAWSQLSSYRADYNLQNADLRNSDWIGAYSFILSEQQRLLSMELVEQEHKAEEAYLAAVKVFRSDVAQTLLTGFDRIHEQITGLTAVLEKAPAFSNDERYKFQYRVVAEHQNLYDFLMRIRTHGAEDNLFGGPGEIPEEFRTLVEGDSNSPLLTEASPLNDHRRFFSYDIEVLQGEQSLGLLSRRFEKASGGEHRTPVYLIFGAALAACYGRSKDSVSGGGIMLLDEAFEKMDPQNIRATVQFLNSLGLQLILAGPESDQAKLSSFLSIYYDMSRFGSRNVQMNKNVVNDAARDLLQSDNYLLNPELLQEQIRLIKEAQDELG